MSAGRVLLDQLLQLGGGERAGAAQVLAEAMRADPALLSAALALCAGDPLVVIATRIAGPWGPPDHSDICARHDSFRQRRVGWVERHGGQYRARLFQGEAMVYVGTYGSLEEARAAVDEVLRGNWVLL